MTSNELSQLKYLKKEVADLNNRIQELNSYSTDTSAKITGMPHVPGVTDKVGKSVDELDYYKRRLNERLNACAKQLNTINDYITECDDSFIRQILTYRYINGDSWNRIAIKLSQPTEYAVKHLAYRYLKQH